MKVYELISKLIDIPAGSDVLISMKDHEDDDGDAIFQRISHISSDDDLLIVYTEEEAN